jgi:hypothetical protein
LPGRIPLARPREKPPCRNSALQGEQYGGDSASVPIGAVVVSLAALAGVDVCGRTPRTDVARRHVPITRVALWITHVALTSRSFAFAAAALRVRDRFVGGQRGALGPRTFKVLLTHRVSQRRHR